MKIEINFAFGETFQNQMLALMLKDVGFAAKVLNYIPEERLFSEKQKYLFNAIKKKITTSYEPLTFIEIEHELLKADKAKRVVLKLYAKQIFATEVENQDFIKDKLSDYAKKNTFITVFMSAQTFWNSRNYEDAFDYTSQGMSELAGINFKDDATIPIAEFDKLRQIYVAKNINRDSRIPTSITPLDDILRGGLEKGEFGILLAEPKKGKSIGLLHMGVSALMHKAGRIAHFVLEGTTEQTVIRYQSRLASIKYRDLEKDNLTDAERKRLDFVQRNYINRLDLIPFNKSWTYSVQDIESKIKELEVIGKKPDLVIVDYADLLKHTQVFKEKRHEQTEVYRDLKRLAMIKNVAIWSASQAQRPKEDPEKTYLLRSHNISESYEKVRIADLVITLNQTAQEKQRGILRFHVDIYRSSEADRTITLLTDFERMIFYSKKYGHANYDQDLQFDWMKKKRRR